MSQPIYAMLLAAGLGTRLKALSRQRPKPMLPVCNQPLVRWAAQLCTHHGIGDLIVNLHHLGHQIRQELGNGEALGAKVSYSPEPEILGTGGGIKAMARQMPRGTCVVLNSKIVVDVDLNRVVAFHRRRGALATMVLLPDPEAEKWGAISVDREGQFTGLLDHLRPGGRGALLKCMFTGIHVLEPEFIEAIPEGPCCVVRTAYTTLFKACAPLAGYIHRGYFQEHSTPERYLQGNFNLLEGMVEPPAAPGPLRGIDPSARVDPTARVIEPSLVGPEAIIEADATVGPRVVLGPGARVKAGVTLQESVVWPQTIVDQDASRCILTPEGRIPEA